MESYQRAHVTVDDHFARFGSKSYAINKITSVDVRAERKDRSLWLILAIIGALFIIVGIEPLISQGNPAVLMVGALLAIPAALLFPKRTSWSYHLILATSAGEVQATTSESREAIDELRAAIETRIAGANG